MLTDVCKAWTHSDFWKNAAVGDVLRCLASECNLMERDHTGASPLHLAAKWSDAEVVRALQDAGACVRSLDNGDRNPLHHAVIRRDVEVVRALLEARPDVNHQSGRRAITALHLAAKQGDDEIVHALLEAGADTELRQRIKYMTPLHFAAAWGNAGSIRALVNAGADVSVIDAYGMTPLMYAPESARSLLETGETGRHGAMYENRNIMFYWNAAPPPEISAVVKEWQNACPTWNVAFFDERTAYAFLQARFGGEIARLFRRCAIPAMQADFFRVFWAMSEGGIYADLAYTPKRNPFFFNPDKDITVYTDRSPCTILTGIFYSKKDSKELKLVAHELIRTISLGRIPHVGLATGPAAWGRALGQNETSTMAIISKDELLRHVVETEYSRLHWSIQQKRMNIYREIAWKRYFRHFLPRRFTARLRGKSTPLPARGRGINDDELI